MFETTYGWLLCMTALTAIGAAAFSRSGAAAALGVGVAASFVAPVWLHAPVSGLPLRVQTCMAVIGLLAFALRSPKRLMTPLVLLDVIVAALVGVHAASDIYHESGPGVALLRAYGEWALPYVAGRYAMREVQVTEKLCSCLSIVVIVLGVGGLTEMLSGVNPWEILFGQRPLEDFPLNASRFGFKRAYGPTLHPIFFGLLILSLAPWPIALLNWTHNGFARRLAVVSLTSLLGIISPVSRSPVLGLAGFLGLYAAIRVRWARWIVGVCGVLLLGWMVWDFNGVLTLFENMANERRKVTNLRLDGENVVMSSAAQRLVLLQVYWPALQEAGVLGYGTRATSVFPPRVPYLPKDERSRNVLRLVDNAYVLLGLRFGWTGMILFLALLLIAGWTGIQLSWDRSSGMIPASLGAMVLAMAATLTTVWFSYDMGFEVLWSIGILAGLAAQRND